MTPPITNTQNVIIDFDLQVGPNLLNPAPEEPPQLKPFYLDPVVMTISITFNSKGKPLLPVLEESSQTAVEVLPAQSVKFYERDQESDLLDFSNYHVHEYLCTNKTAIGKSIHRTIQQL